MKRIIFFISLLGSLAAIAQPSTSYLGGTNTLVISRNDFRVDSTLQNPLRDTTFTPSRVGIQVYKTGDGLYVSISTSAAKKWDKLAFSASSVTWGSITGDLEDQTDLDAALDAKQNSITTGTTAQYLDGTLALRNFASEVTSITDPLYSPLAHSHNGLNPTGGATGQVLKKNSSTNYDYSWQDEAGGGGSGDMLKATYDVADDGTADGALAQPTLTYGASSTYASFPRNGKTTLDLDLIGGQATASSNIPFHNGANLAWNSGLAIRSGSIVTAGNGADTLATKDYARSLVTGGGYTDADAKAANPQSKHITIESPSTLENIGLFFTDVAITITKVADVLIGTSSPSVTWQVNHASNRNGSPNTLFSSGRATTSASGATTTSFNDATIPANSWVWITTSANAGSVTQLEVTLIYTID